MGVPIVYKSTYGNAPVLAAVNGSVVNLLNKCLVTGYGDKQGAGWTMPFVNVGETIAVFRQSAATGNGFYLGVDTASPSYAYRARLRTAEVFTTETAYQFQIGYTGDWDFASGANTNAVPWCIVATPEYLYFFAWEYTTGTALPTSAHQETTSSTYCGSFFFGDFISYFPDDHYNTLFWWGGYGVTDPFGAIKGENNATSSSKYIARAVSGAAGAVGCTAMAGPPCTTTGNYAWGGGVGATYPGNTALLASRVYVNNSAAYTVRGHLPRLLAVGVLRPFENGATVQIDGEDYLSVVFRALAAYLSTSVASALFKLTGDEL